MLLKNGGTSKAIGADEAAKSAERDVVAILDAKAICESKTPAERAEIELIYEREYGYKKSQPLPAPSGLGVLEPGGMLNPIHIKIENY